ncbi:type II secretion system protein [Clostridium fermenticellae]|uniref:Type II secretion system protein n=1 Tax=Clostridium fermenticellae TaxID=2068654 RepID=A0A386H4D7_9CLOT|nr:type II secretion system protein [Clostridium fermenticellae]AYD40611.1 type II secretion system protein [Clostridium fermenticellae]
MKTKGFTLIEMILCLSIIFIVFSYSLINYSGFNKLQNKIYSEEFGSSLINFINNSKSYCRDHNNGGYIYFDLDKNYIIFINATNRIYTLMVPDGFKLMSVRNNNRIEIDNRGITESACTIKYIDRERQSHFVTMCVGSAYVEFKE